MRTDLHLPARVSGVRPGSVLDGCELGRREPGRSVRMRAKGPYPYPCALDAARSRCGAQPPYKFDGHGNAVSPQVGWWIGGRLRAVLHTRR